MANEIDSDSGLTALHAAVADGDAAAVERLLVAGADPNIRDHGESGNTPFMAAVLSGNVRVVAPFLDDYRTDWDKSNARGQTPRSLMRAAK